MGTFSPAHWIIALALLAALGAFAYLVFSLMLAGAKEKGRGKLIAAVVLLPIAILAIIGLNGAANSGNAAKDTADVEWWKQGATPIN